MNYNFSTHIRHGCVCNIFRFVDSNYSENNIKSVPAEINISQFIRFLHLSHDRHMKVILFGTRAKLEDNYLSTDGTMRSAMHIPLFLGYCYLRLRV